MKNAVILLIIMLLVTASIVFFQLKYSDKIDGIVTTEYADSIKSANKMLTYKLDSLELAKNALQSIVLVDLRKRRFEYANAANLPTEQRHDTIVKVLNEYDSDSLLALYKLTVYVKLKALQLDSCVIENTYLTNVLLIKDSMLFNSDMLITSYERDAMIQDKHIKRVAFYRNLFAGTSVVLLIVALL